MPAARLARAALLSLSPLALLALVAPALRLPPVPTELVRFAVATAAIVLASTAVPDSALARPLPAVATIAAGAGLCLLALLLPPVASGLAGSLGLLAAGCALGCVVGSRMEAAGHLLAVALASAAVDLWSVTSPAGPTHQIVQRPALMRLLTISAAALPSRDPSPIIGFGDVAFAAVYASACARFELSRARTAVALALGLFSAGAVAVALERAVPALPLLGAAVVLAHPEARRVPLKDRAATWATAAMLVASVARAALR